MMKTPSENSILRSCILLAAALHDIGKADRTIQDFFLQPTRQDPGRRLRKSHALAGLPIIHELLSGQLPDEYSSLVMLAIASHHTPLHPDLYLNMSPTLEVADDDREEVATILNRLTQLLVHYGYPSIETEFDWSSLSSPKRVFVKAKNVGIRHIMTSTNPENLRRQYVLIQGILEQSDWLASGDQNPIEDLTFPRAFLSSEGKEIVADETQQTAMNTKGNVFIIRPTGRRKTETALFWAKANTPSSCKVFYVLPTMVTINAMFKRLERNFSSQTGLYHSSADLFMEQLHSSENVDDSFSLNLYRYFFLPVNVTTPDQIILSLLNYKRFTLKSLPLEGASLILDEIQAYDGETFALIKAMLRHLTKTFGVKTCVMSATFPDVFQRELSFLNPTLIPSLDNIRAEYKERQRTKYEYIDKPMASDLDRIFNECRRSKKVLVVLNTVRRSQVIYAQLSDLLVQKNVLKEDEIALLHSRFTFRDRNEKEAHLDPERPEEFPKLLVATQVVEVSLDINYDTMFTEACYPADLVQRLGRINRRGTTTDNVNVFVYRPESHFPYEKNLLLYHGVPLIHDWQSKIQSEWDYLEMGNQFYEEMWNQFCSPKDEARYDDVWNKLSYIFSADLSDTEIKRLLQTRSGILTLPAVPICYEGQIESLNNLIEQHCDLEKKAQLFREKRRLLVDVPVTKDTTNLFTTKGYDRFIHCVYDSRLGLQINMPVDNIL